MLILQVICTPLFWGCDTDDDTVSSGGWLGPTQVKYT